MTLKTLSKYPSNLRRGGSLFTMIIFIMLLISTALMYYYFQRTRFLERQITALQNGEQPEPNGLSNFVSWIKGTQPSDSEDLNAAAEPPKSTPRPQPVAVATPVIEPDTLPESMQPAPQAMTDAAPALLPLTEDTTQPAQMEVQGESDTLPDNVENSENSPDLEAENDNDNPTANQPINSLYDTQQPPPVRVRSPQRR